MLVVEATVVGNVAAKNPLGCVYVAMRLDIVVSRFDAVSPVTALTVSPVPSATPFMTLLPMLAATVKSPAVVSCQTPVAICAAVNWFVTVVTVVIVPPVMFVVEARVAFVGKVTVPPLTTGFVLLVSTSTVCVVGPIY